MHYIFEYALHVLPSPNLFILIKKVENDSLPKRSNSLLLQGKRLKTVKNTSEEIKGLKKPNIGFTHLVVRYIMYMKLHAC